MRSEMVGLIGVMVLVLLMFSGMWIGMAMLFVGVLGLVILNGFHGALGVLANVPYSAIADYPLTSLPLFMFMGAVLSNTRVGEDLYDTAYKWIGQLRGARHGYSRSLCRLCNHIRLEHSYCGYHG